MPNCRFGYIPGQYLNPSNTGDATVNGIADPVTGQIVPGGSLVLGDYADFTDSEAKQSSNPSGIQGATLYHGRYQRVVVDSGADATQLVAGRQVYVQSVAKGPYVVTSYNRALNSNRAKGVLLISPAVGKYCFIETRGWAWVLMKTPLTNATPLVGDVIVAAANGLADDPTQTTQPTYAQVEQMIGIALTLPGASGYCLIELFPQVFEG
jgi:hypothetical protein